MMRRFFQRLASLGRSMAKALTALVLLSHLALTTIYVLPDNPIKAAAMPILDRTIDVYAKQTWQLFAPDPISNDFILLARCLDSHTDAAQVAAILGGADGGGWSDLSKPLWAAYQAQRFAAYDRLARPLTATARTYLTGGSSLTRWREACHDKHDQEACEFYGQALEEARDATLPKLQRLGSSYCLDVEPNATHVALRLRIVDSVPWSRRFDSTYVRRVADLSLGLHQVDRSIHGAGLYRRERE